MSYFQNQINSFSSSVISGSEKGVYPQWALKPSFQSSVNSAARRASGTSASGTMS